MSRPRRRKGRKFSAEPVKTKIDSLSHDGRGVAHIEDKAVFIDGALPGEEVMFVYTGKRKSYDEGKVVEVLTPSSDRVEAKCEHFGICGGCSLQHLDPEKQILVKQSILLENFSRIGKVQPEDILPPVTGPHWGYRRKARLGVKYVRKKERVLVGFREKRNPFLADINQCEVLHPSVGLLIDELASLIGSMEAYNRIAQIEVAVSDKNTALVFRNLDDLAEKDLQALVTFSEDHELYLYLQPAGPDSVQLIWPEPPKEGDSDSKRPALSYQLDGYDLEIWFEPTDFTQVNSEINQKMVDLALELLDINKTDRVLDLFCGIGNFSLALARKVAEVVAVEGEKKMVQRAQMNAAANKIDNIQFYVANLYAEDQKQKPEWRTQQYDKVLLDPPRSGAFEVLDQIAGMSPSKIVYVSCHPGSLARDAGELVNKHGYRLAKAGVMDMFPHTAHVESIALFEKK